MDSHGAKNPDNGIPPTDSDLRRQYLVERDVSCPGCGYNLRGLAAGACPECNQDLELGIKLASPRIGRLVAALTGLAVGAGGSGAVLALQVMPGALWGGGGPVGARPQKRGGGREGDRSRRIEDATDGRPARGSA